MRYLNSILEAIGQTPLIRLNRLAEGLKATILVKAEFLNPGSSNKDRVGLRMILDAEAEGRLRPGGTIIESTSGNTGFGIALVAAVKGYRCIFTLPDKVSREKQNLLRALGAEIVVTPTDVDAEDPRSYYSVARRLAEEMENAIYINQYENPSNPRAHYLTTGPEIWEQTEGRVDFLVAGMGTGGTICGAGRYLKERKPSLELVGVDPVGSLYYDYWKEGKRVEPGRYLVEGIGEDFFPKTMDLSLIDRIYRTEDEESFLMARRLARQEGIFTGGSGGAAVLGALRLAREIDEERVIVVVVPDTGERYLSKLYNDDWMRERGFLRKEGEE
ncbi:MAG: cysteine synthase family protein [Planctomycetota bacterium]|nr:MAG: cysteine synthase family protein [Planctomycetota bacterium]